MQHPFDVYITKVEFECIEYGPVGGIFLLVISAGLNRGGGGTGEPASGAGGHDGADGHHHRSTTSNRFPIVAPREVLG
jgi:hypothetical protein